MVNKVILVRNVASDPDVRASQGGTFVTKVRIATNVYAGKSDDGTVKEHTDFHNLVFFGKTAETAGTYLHKGQLLYIEGQLRNSSWDDAATGQKRYRTEVVVEAFKFLGPKQQSQEAAA